ncbi:amino acid adenylation domain-containing protein [Candidatus Symbiopectobacterium sp. NZEC127]|uniref:non-ribosomal peptide synthetase n=1 Tax=Candidatus Symbiopectobacterium sp. NZEC127 TaxID=2820472 RepID=UPI002225D208|nr:non-ribosomal peptide synthetase [Candidatus Symbiopectobacterium sp. NZEC127]MCW2485252.1 amino acid adenylation domain-containing protein [Candidatus Symbiopectobacterium sp. NZEC127]
MNIADFVATLELQGIELWCEENNLHFRAPAGTLSETVKGALREHKPALLAYLASRNESEAMLCDRQGRFTPFPLTETQQAWLMGRHSAFAYGGLSCRGFLAVSFPAALEPARLEQALQQLIVRHDMLRVVVKEEGFQRVLSTVPDFALPTSDLRQLGAEPAQRAVDRLRDTLLSAPSDYATWPLFAAHAVRLARETQLLLAVELIALDAASLYLLVDELALLLFNPEQLPPVPDITFRDCVIARRAAREGKRYRDDRRYWLARLDALPDAPQLPLAEATADAPFLRRQRLLSASQVRQLGSLAGEHQVTLSVLLLGAFAQVLALYSQQRHFTLNLPVFRRDQRHPDIQRVLGDFTDTVLLEVDLQGTAPFGEQLRALSQRLCDAMDHASYSGLELLRERSRRRGEAQLMPVVFTSTLGQRAKNDGNKAHYHIVQGMTQTPQVLIDCQVVEQPEGILLAWDSREALFPPALIEQAFDLYCSVINRLIEEGEGCMQQVRPVSLPAAFCHARQRANASCRAYPAQLLHQGMVDQAERRPEATALIDEHGTLSYQQLLTQATGLAARLQQAGHQPAQRVAIFCDKGRGQALAALATLLCGGCYVPFYLKQPTARRDLMLQDADISWAIADDLTSLPAGINALDWRGEQPAHPFTPVAVAPEQPAYLIYTSGSTGTPKGVVMSHRAAWNTLADINHRFAVGAQDAMLALANLSFDLAVYDLFGVLAAGGRLVYPHAAQQGDPAHWAAQIQRHDITLWNSVPSQLQMLCDVQQPLAPLRVALVSGDWVPRGLHESLSALQASAELFALGGATEAGIWSVCCPVNGLEAHWAHAPYGAPLANQRLYVVDDAMNDRPDWVAGEIAIAGASLADGYWQDAEKTAQRFVTARNGERRYLTGDRGRYWPDGRIEFLGRYDQQVKIHGHRVELGEITATLRQHPAVADGVALLTTDGTLHGVVETAAGQQSAAISVTDAARDCAQQLERGMDAPAFTALMAAADRVAMLAMAARLRADGLFGTEQVHHSLDEIYQATHVAQTHRRLLRRWLDALVGGRALMRDAQGHYRDLMPSDNAALDDAWQQVDRLEQRTRYGSLTLDYIRACSEDLAGLLRGERDVRGLLFPQGELSTAQAAYRDNVASRSMNAIAIAAITEFAKQCDRPLRLLEVGAGVAGTASELVPALAAYGTEYWFTDLSTFFLTEARKRFADYHGMHYGLFDMNLPAASQGMQANSMDVILCANVLHNARHAGEVLSGLAQLLTPGGILVFIEPVRRHNYPLLVSMEFFPELTGFTDLRAETDQTFFTREQWLDLLQQAGATLLDCAPAAHSALATSGQGVFIAQFKTDRASVCDARLRAYLQTRLPAHMIPTQLHVWDALPRNASGKIDRPALAQTLLNHASTAASQVQGDALCDALEHDIAAIWSEVLDTEIVTRDADFYACGGDSLLLSRMIGRLRERVAAANALTWGSLLRHLLQDPTLKALSARLRQVEKKQTAASSTPVPLVTLWETAGVSSHPCVLLHAGSGDMQPYRHVLPELDKSAYSCGIGIELPSPAAFMALPPPQALVRLAGQYADALCERGERFTLIGYCLGGLLAAEMARQLSERGVCVQQLVVISAWQPPRVEDVRLVEYVFARSHGACLEALRLPSESALAEAVHHVLCETPSHIPAGAFDRLPDAYQPVGDALSQWAMKPLNERLRALQTDGAEQGAYFAPEGEVQAFAERHALFHHCMAAVGEHQPAPWTGKTLLIRNSASDPLLPGTPQDVTDYWQRLSLGDLTVVDTPGDHFSCMAQPHAASLANCIARHTRPEEAL